MGSQRSITTALLLLGGIVVFWFGYMWVADYGDGVASGTYNAVIDGQRSILVLRSNHTFHQTSVSSRMVSEADGTWRRIGEGGLVFSGGMLALPGQRRMQNGDIYATLYKTGGVWPFIVLDSDATAPIYRKALF